MKICLPWLPGRLFWQRIRKCENEVGTLMVNLLQLTQRNILLQKFPSKRGSCTWTNYITYVYNLGVFKFFSFKIPKNSYHRNHEKWPPILEVLKSKVFLTWKRGEKPSVTKENIEQFSLRYVRIEFSQWDHKKKSLINNYVWWD